MKSSMPAVLICLILVALSGCGHNVANLDSKGENIICFGDSLTEGVGAERGKDYPAVLSEKLGRDVINAGRRAETSRDALKRIQKDVLDKNPRLVIVEFGGNDYLQKFSSEDTFRNLDEIVRRIQERGAMVVLATVKAGLFSDAYGAGFRRIAKRRKAVLVADILKGIMTNPHLKSDYIHPNAEGYKIIAERISRAVAPLLKDR